MVAPVFTSPISPKCSQSSSEASFFFLASAMTSSLVLPEGSDTTTSSWTIGKLSWLLKATSVGPDLIESGNPVYLNFCTPTLKTVSPPLELDAADAGLVVCPLAQPFSASAITSVQNRTSVARPTVTLPFMTTSSPDDGSPEFQAAQGDATARRR